MNAQARAPKTSADAYTNASGIARASNKGERKAPDPTRGHFTQGSEHGVATGGSLRGSERTHSLEQLFDSLSKAGLPVTLRDEDSAMVRRLDGMHGDRYPGQGLSEPVMQGDLERMTMLIGQILDHFGSELQKAYWYPDWSRMGKLVHVAPAK